MAVELEAKIKVGSLETVRASLRQLGATCIARRFERNVYFDTPDRKLLAADEGVRTRTIVPLDRVAEDKHVVTFKGPQVGSGLKQREEIEFAVESADAAGHLLGRLGYLPCLGFEKRRESWTWPADGCQFDLDELPLLGCFLEIEGPSAEAVHGALARLNLAGAELITRSYIAMIEDEVTRRRLSDAVIRFHPSADE